MGLHVSLLLHTTDPQGLKTSVMTEKVEYFQEVKNKPDQCNVVFDGGNSLIVMVSHDEFNKAIEMLEGDHLKGISDSDL